VKANIDVVVMRDRLDVQIVRVVDVVADVEQHRQRMRGSQIRADDIGQMIADRAAQRTVRYFRSPAIPSNIDVW
jgi:hypothetical protein